MGLAILTPKGQEYAKKQRVAADTVLERGWSCALTDLEGSASVDGIFIENGIIRSVAEIKARDTTMEILFGPWRGNWLITHQKLEDLRMCAQLLRVPGYGILYLVNSGIVLMKRLCEKDGKYCQEFLIKETRTQATCNGGSVIRANAFIPMGDAQRYMVWCQQPVNSHGKSNKELPSLQIDRIVGRAVDKIRRQEAIAAGRMEIVKKILEGIDRKRRKR